MRLRYTATINPSKGDIASLPRDTEVTFLPMEAVGEQGTLNLERTRSLGDVENGYTYFRDGDALIAKITPCFENGKGAIATNLRNGIGFGTTELTVLRPRPGYSSRFLYYLTCSHEFRKKAEGAMQGTGGQKRVPDDIFRDHDSWFPSYKDQEYIASFLDEQTAHIDTLIAEKKRLVEILQECRRAVIIRTLTKGVCPGLPMKNSGYARIGDIPSHWIVTRIKRELVFLDSQRIPLSGEERGKRQGEYPYYGASGIIDYVDRYIFDEPSILVGEDGANLLLRSTPLAFIVCGKYWVNNHAHVLKPKDGLINYWANMLEAIDFTPVVSGSAQPKLTIDALENTAVACPPSQQERLDIEQQIQKEVPKYEELIQHVKEHIKSLREYRFALISAAVMGKIEVRNYKT